MLKETLAVIRKTNPTRNVIIGPAFWNNIHYLDKLELPADDRHIIVTVHYYLPMEFTHQGASWNKETAKLSGVTWGTEAEKHRVEEDFAGVQEWSKKEGRPIFLGEFGAYEKGEWIPASATPPALRAQPNPWGGCGLTGNSMAISSPTTWPKMIGYSPSGRRLSPRITRGVPTASARFDPACAFRTCERKTLRPGVHCLSLCGKRVACTCRVQGSRLLGIINRG